jgi:MFS family permease
MASPTAAKKPLDEANEPTKGRFLIFFASFMTLIAAGMGFAIRAGILDDWSTQFGFTKAQLGGITGGGLVGFGVTIIFFSLFVDLIGYKALLILAFLLHALSAVITLAATPVFNAAGQDPTYWCLWVGMFIFALANGVCESVINPLVATLYPRQKTHYLNILHAGWPGGLIVGGLIAYLICGPQAQVTQLRWEIPMALFLLPTVMYGLIVLIESFPQSEARAAGVSFGQMLAQFASPLLLFLFLLHAMVGYVELGTDSWITNIMNNTIPGKATLLFVYTSALMFVLRFFAGPIVEKINPLGLLLGSAVLACVGLYALGSVTAGAAILVAATVYGLGKTFFWPTMLGVVGEQFPRGGALTMGTIGGIGMLSAGLLGGPGIGYKQDYYASQYLQAKDPTLYEQYKAQDVSTFLMFPAVNGLDGAKVGELDAQLAGNAEAEAANPVLQAELYGGRMALKWTALVPAMMAVGYLLLVLYYASQGGYRQKTIHHVEPGAEGEEYTGGVAGPVQA